MPVEPIEVNDVHSRLNPTRVAEVCAVGSVEELLTYHRWNTRELIGRCHPRFEAFLQKKLDYVPHEELQSDWYRHHRRLFGG